MATGIGDLLIQLGQTLPATVRKHKQDIEDKQRQDEQDRLAAALQNAQIAEYQRKTAEGNQATADTAAARKILSEYSARRGAGSVADALSKIDLNGMAGDTQGAQPSKLIPQQQADVARQANERYPSLGNLPAQAVLNKPALNVADVVSAGYKPGPGREVPSSPISGSPSEASLAQGQDELSRGRQYAGLSDRDLLDSAGGRQYADVGPMKDTYTAFEKQQELKQKADEVAALAEQNRAFREGESGKDREMRIEIARMAEADRKANKELTLTNNERQWTESQWQKFATRTNALNTNSRSALGQSGVANVRAARAMDVLVNKDIVGDPYAYDLVNMDIQGIMKGGSPVEQQMKEKYRNLQTKLASTWQHITANPTEINQPGVKKQLLTIISSLREIDNNILDKNLGVEKVAFQKIIHDDPDRAQDFFSALQQSKDVFPQDQPEPGRSPRTGQTIQGPPIGTVKSGYKFMGGDPSKEENWTLVR